MTDIQKSSTGTRMTPPSVRSSFRSFFQRSSKEFEKTPRELKPVTDDDILAIIDDIYMRAKGQLLQGNYKRVMETFLFLTEYDVMFKKIISSQLTNIKGDFLDVGILNEEIMSFLIMIQSYYNSFRINLLSDVVDHIYDLYRKAMSNLQTDYQRSLKQFYHTNNMMNYMIDKLKNWYAPNKGDYFFDMLYEEFKGSFQELKIHAARQLQKLINTQLRML